MLEDNSFVVASSVIMGSSMSSCCERCDKGSCSQKKSTAIILTLKDENQILCLGNKS